MFQRYRLLNYPSILRVAFVADELPIVRYNYSHVWHVFIIEFSYH